MNWLYTTDKQQAEGWCSTIFAEQQRLYNSESYWGYDEIEGIYYVRLPSEHGLPLAEVKEHLHGGPPPWPEPEEDRISN